MPDTQERRIISAIYRAMSSDGDAFYRALDRIALLADEVLMLEAWYRVRPSDRPLIDKWLAYRIARSSPLRSIVRRPADSLPYPMKITRTVM